LPRSSIAAFIQECAAAALAADPSAALAAWGFGIWVVGIKTLG